MYRLLIAMEQFQCTMDWLVDERGDSTGIAVDEDKMALKWQWASKAHRECRRQLFEMAGMSSQVAAYSGWGSAA